MKKFGNKKPATPENTPIAFSDTPFSLTSKPPLPLFATANKADSFSLNVRVARIENIRTAIQQFIDERLKVETMEEIIASSFGKLGLLYLSFTDVYKHSSSHTVKIEEFRILLKEINPSLVQLFDLQSQMYESELRASIKQKIHTVHGIFDEWFNEVNLTVFLEQNNMKAQEIYDVFYTAYTTPDAPWEIVPIRENEFVPIFKDYIREVYNKTLQ